MMTIHKLSNGITVLLSKHENAKTAAVYVGVSVGSMHEKTNRKIENWLMEI